MKLLLFAGTTEGRELAERLAILPVEVTVCVATEYGGEILSGLPEHFRVLVGRLTGEEICELMRDKEFRYVIDATHPYAVTASENIEVAAAAVGLTYLRLTRPESDSHKGIHVASAAEAAAKLIACKGNVLLTTGSKELASYTIVPDFAERMYPRVLPSVESIRECERLGFRCKHIIAMQGPFGRDLNRAIMLQYDIDFMVTKDSGTTGGFSEKMLAAQEAGVQAIVIGRPTERLGLGGEFLFRRIAGEVERQA